MTTTYATRCSSLRALLSDGLEHSGAELERVGGRRYGSRVHEIRRGNDGGQPIAIDCETRGSESYWRARPYRDDEERPRPRASLAQLQALVLDQQRLIERQRCELERLRNHREPRQASLFVPAREAR